MGLAERVQAAALRLLIALPPRVKRLIAGPPIRIDGNEVELDIAVLLRINRANPRPPVETRGAERGREDLLESTRIVAGPPIPVAEVRALQVAGAAGPLDARLYVPHDDQGSLLVFLHGGGWVVGDLESHDAPCRALANASGSRILSVAYRLAPEHPYPAALEDALAAFADATARAEELGADAQRIGIGGDSAGGLLSALVAQRAEPACQVLVYPAIDFVEEYESERLFADGFLLTKSNMDWYEEQFVPREEDKHAASPLRADSVEGVAPAFVLTAGFDPLRDEGELYAAKLRDAGVPTVLRRHPGQVHGFLNMTGVGSAAHAAIGEIGGFVRTVLAAR
jgi:acetyl esterase